jgi:hypothetical protein
VRLFSRAQVALGPGIGALVCAVVLRLVLPLLSFVPLGLALASGAMRPVQLREAPPLLWGTCALWGLTSLWLQAGVMNLAARRVRGRDGSFGDSMRGLLGAPSGGLLWSALLAPCVFGVGFAVVRRLGAWLPAIGDVAMGVLVATAVIWLLVLALGGSFAAWATTDRRYGYAHALRFAWERTSGRRFRALTVNGLAVLPWVSFAALLATRAPFAIGVALVLVVPVSVLSAVVAATGYVLLVSPRALPETGDSRTLGVLPGVAWAAGAVFLHLFAGTGGLVVNRAANDRDALARLVGRTSGLLNVTEIEIVSEVHVEKPTEEPPKDSLKEPDSNKADLPKKEESKVAPQIAKAPPPKKKPEALAAKKPLIVKPLIVKKDDEEKRVLPELDTDKRIAVRQHSEDNHTENPNAKFIAEKARRVQEETQARQTAHDQNDKNPTPGGQHTGNDPSPGDSHRNKIADSEAHKGAKDLAPGERGSQDQALEPMGPTPKEPVAIHPTPAPVATATPASQDPARAPAAGQGPVFGSPESAQNVTPKIAEGAARPTDPVVSAPGGGVTDFDWSTAEILGAKNGQKPVAKQPRRASQFGLGHATGPSGGLNLNLTQDGVVRVKGSDSAESLRQASGERRRSEHRGSWNGNVFERMRNASENYVSNVKVGNQTALNAASSAFATYLQTMHNRIHPIFADSFLESLSGRSRDDALNNMRLITTLEIVLHADGSLAKMGLIKSSGEFQFDVGALDSVNRAQPFGKVPAAIISPDGNTYLHWQFHRNEVYACSTMNARPYILRDSPKPTEPPYPPGLPGPSDPKSPTKERFPTGNDGREGFLWLPTHAGPAGGNLASARN